MLEITQISVTVTFNVIVKISKVLYALRNVTAINEQPDPVPEYRAICKFFKL